MDNTPDLVGKIVCLPGGVMVRVEKIYEDGPHDGITAICEVAKLEPCDEANDAETPKPSAI
jgi:hypothetical protein